MPAVAETLPGFDVDLWTAIFAPAGLPPPVLSRLNSEINKALQHPEMKAALAKIGVEPRGTGRRSRRRSRAAEYEKWKQVIAEGKIKSE